MDKCGKGVLIVVLIFQVLMVRVALAQEPESDGEDISHQLSPDGQWTAIVNPTAGSLELFDQRQGHPVFSEGSGVNGVEWSPDSRRLLVVRSDGFTRPNHNRKTGDFKP